MTTTPIHYAFIDSQNLNLAIHAQGWRLDFKRFRRYLADKYGVAKAFLFIGYVPTQQNLYTALQEYGYVVVFKPTLRLADGRVKGNVEYLKKEGKLHRLLIPNRHQYSALLRRFASQMAFISDFRGKLEYPVA